MEWHLENARFLMTVKANGAELSQLWDKDCQRDWIWSPQPDVWNHSATQLFPVVGRLIHNGLWQEERFFPLSAHGFLRYQAFECVEQDASRLVIEVSDSASTREAWPFAWRVRIEWALSDNGFSVVWRVMNRDRQPWGYSLGWHPGFALPVASQPGWQVRFTRACSGPFATVERTLVIPDAPPDVTAFTLQRDSFANGAVYFNLPESARWVLCSPDGCEQIVFSGSQPWIALWGVPGADLLCVEPLSGTTDDPLFDGQIAHKRGIQWLHPGEEHRHWVSARFPADREE